MRDKKDDYFAKAPIPRFSRGLGFQDEQQKSANNWAYPPPQPQKNVLACISVFLLFAEALWKELLLPLPPTFNSLNSMRYVSKPCSSCRKILMHVPFEGFNVFLFLGRPREFYDPWIINLRKVIMFKFSFICNNVTYKMWRHTIWEPMGHRRSPIYAPFLAFPNALNWWTAP